MEGRFDSPTHGASSTVPQIPVEYDDLYMQKGPYANQRDFSHDINKRMKMPNRLSVDGKNLHDLEVENMRAQSSTSQSTVAGMAIPDKITLSGSANRGALDDQYAFMNSVGPERTDYVNITTPPRVLTVDERFPVIEDGDELLSTPSKTLNNTANESSAANLELSSHHMSKQLALPTEDAQQVLLQRVHYLETREQHRQQREMVLYSALSIYIGYRFVRWLMGT